MIWEEVQLPQEARSQLPLNWVIMVTSSALHETMRAVITQAMVDSQNLVLVWLTRQLRTGSRDASWV